MSRIRDEQLARELARLPVPEYGPEFLPGLREQLEREESPRRLRFRWSRLPYAAAAAAAAVAVGLVAYDATRGADVATAAEVRAAVRAALGSVESVRGVIVLREQAGGGETRWSFVLDAAGNFRAEAVPSGPVWAYDATGNVERYSDQGIFMERTGVAPGPPDISSSAWMVQRGLGSVLAALEAAGDAEAREVDHIGRPAWVLRVPALNGEEREVTVDRETGLPVRDVRLRGERVVGEWRIDGLETGEAPPAGAFRLTPETGQEVTRFDHGFRPATLSSAASAVGYAPLVPAWLPAGFELAEVAVAGTVRPPTGHEQRQNPESEDVVSLAYRRGLDRLVVTTRRITGERSAWTDPVARGDLTRAPAHVPLAAGALAGTEVEVAIDPNAVPHLWGLTDSLVLTVAGDAGRAELLRIAESLAPARD